jgi:hypothetical protein
MVLCRVRGPSGGEIPRIAKLVFDGDHPKAVLSRQRGSFEPLVCVALDADKLRKIGPADSRTYVYEGAITSSALDTTTSGPSGAYGDQSAIR